LASKFIESFQANSFKNVAKVPKKDFLQPISMLYFVVKTINNLPLLLEVSAILGTTTANMLFRILVLPRKPLLEEFLTLILGADKRHE
jgi:hypothetical protein